MRINKIPVKTDNDFLNFLHSASALSGSDIFRKIHDDMLTSTLIENNKPLHIFLH